MGFFLFHREKGIVTVEAVSKTAIPKIVGAYYRSRAKLSLRGAKRRRNLGGGRDCFAREEKGKTCLAPTCNDQMRILTQPLLTAINDS